MESRSNVSNVYFALQTKTKEYYLFYITILEFNDKRVYLHAVFSDTIKHWHINV